MAPSHFLVPAEKKRFHGIWKKNMMTTQRTILELSIRWSCHFCDIKIHKFYNIYFKLSQTN